jgi:hypothetical protein
LLWEEAVTSDGFRKIALGLPEASEGEHMGHPDFRVRGKIFATLHPDGKRGVVMLCPEDQFRYVREAPGTFRPAAGAWGRQGSTEVLLESASADLLRRATLDAWRNKAPDDLMAASQDGRAGRPRRSKTLGRQRSKARPGRKGT